MLLWYLLSLHLVERWQRFVLMRTAVLSDSIVSSLLKQCLHTKAQQQTIEAKQQNQQPHHPSRTKDDPSSTIPLIMKNNRNASACSTTSSDH